MFQKLAQGRFDLTIDLQGLLRSALMTAATRARVRVGVADAREGARWFYTDGSTHPGWVCTRWSAFSASPAPSSADASAAAVQPADQRGRPPVGSEVAGGSAVAQDRAQRGSALGDQALAPRAFRRDRPPCGPRIRGGLDRRRLGLPTGRSSISSVRRSGPGARSRPLRPDEPARAGRAGGRVGPGDLQRHRPASPGGGGRGARGRHLHLHQPQAHRSLRPAGRHRTELRLVRSQLHQEMPPT